jgi:hypothetical protein
MGLGQTKEQPKPLMEIIRKNPESDPCINVYQRKDTYNKEGSARDYLFQGVLPSDTKRFFLLFKKEDEEDLPLAIPFELRDDFFLISQYHFLKPSMDKKKEEVQNLILQFPESNLTDLYVCDVSPSFPFPVEITGEIILKK